MFWGWKIPLVFFCAMLLLCVAISFKLFRMAFLRSCSGPPKKAAGGLGGGRWGERAEYLKECRTWLAEQVTEQITITAKDGVQLCGQLLLGSKPTGRVVIAVHGYRSNASREFAAIAPFFRAKGWDLLLVDDRAHGKSGGKIIGFGCLDRYDVQSWAEYCADRYGVAGKIVLYGVSMGAASVLMAQGLALPRQVCGVIADCGFTSPWEQLRYLLRRDYHLTAFPILYLVDLFCRIYGGYGLRDCAADQSAAKSGLPTLLIHGAKDRYVPYWMGEQIAAACGADAMLLKVEDAAHAESYYINRPLYEQTTAAFLQKVEGMQR